MAWKYLLSPTFQVVNTAGKPSTGGYIEVYIHGTRDRYYCASDFDGTLHPFKIPLDSIGANIVLADDSQTYDVYVYNRYGSLIMSRYDVPTVRGKDSAYSGDVSDATSTLTKNEGDLSSMASGMSIKTILTSISNFFASLKKVAFSASYNDLSDKPSIPAAQVNSDWNANSGVAKILNRPSLATVATTGNYEDLSNKPSIPDDTVLVHKTGAETITGIKTFNNNVSPRQLGSIFSKQSKVFTCSVIKPYDEWSAAEQDDNHFRLWTIDITSIVTVASTHCNIVVKLMGSWYSYQGNGALQKEITLQVYNGNIVFSKEDYTVAQAPCANEFVISGVIKSGSSYLLQVLNRNPTANNYPLRLEIEVFNKNDSILDNVTLNESITDGLPVWAVDLPQVTANGSPVITKATAVKDFFVATYNDTNYSDVEDAYFDNEQLVFCERGTYLYQLKRRYSDKFIFEGTVDKDDGTFETITLDSSNVWTIETHSVDEYCVYRKAYDNLHPLSTSTTATDISNGYMDVEFDLGNADGFGVGEGHALVFIGIPNKGGPSGVDFANAFTKIELYAIDDDSSLQTPYLAAKVKDPSKDDYGDSLGPNDLYMWNRTYSGNRTSVITVKKFRARYYLNMNTAWVPNLATNFYIYFTILL